MASRQERLARSFEALQGAGQGSRHNVKVMQWNVLADGLAQNGEFVKVPKEALLWENRSPLLLAEILSSEADMVCLQEVNHYDDFFAPQLQAHGYTGLFWPKACSPAEQYGYACDGCALFFRSQRFTMLGEAEGLTFRSMDASNGKQVMLFARLLDKATGLQLLLATTHLKAKEGAANDQMREMQAKQLVERLQSASEEMESSRNGTTAENGCGSRPLVVLAGDFNTTPDSSACQVLRQHPLGLRSLWDERPSTGGANATPAIPFTTWKYRPGGESQRTIDYIWWATDARMQPSQRWRMLTAGEIGPAGLPSWQYGSDHIALCAIFDLLPDA